MAEPKHILEEKIIEYLLKGFTQKEIEQELKKYNLKPCSLSSIEKNLKQLRKKHNVKTMFHLGVVLSKTKKVK